MASDNVRDKDRDRFEQLYVEVMELVLHRAIELNLPNACTETIAARMLAMRAVACDQDIVDVANRVAEYALNYGEEHATEHEHARALGRKMRAWGKVKH